MKYIYFFTLILIVFFACTKKEKDNKIRGIDSNNNIYIIDLDNLQDRQKVNSSQLFGEVETIILETNEKCLIGNINRMQLFDEYIFILDSHKSRALFVFKNNGQYSHRIGRIGNGPGEYTEPIDFTIDTKNNVIYLLDTNQIIHKYELSTGEYIESINVIKDNSRIRYIQYLDGKLFADNYSFDKSNGDYLLQELNPETGKSEAFWLKKDEYNKGWNELYSTDQDFFSMRVSDSPKYFQLFMDTIIEINKNGIIPYLVLNSKELTTKDDIKTFDRDNLHERMIQLNKIYNIYSHIENKDFILFYYRKALFSYIVHYDLKKKVAKKISLNNDLIYKKDAKTQISLQFKFSDTLGAYQYISGYNMELLMNGLDKNEINPNLNKLSELKALTEDSNPIIFFYKYK